jgi:tripartite-type tricarboxylate transporter receptor subunit TctC
LVELARQKPDELICGAGNTSGRLGAALLNGIPGVSTRIAVYDGEAAVLRDIQGGFIDCTFVSMATAIPHIEAGTVQALGTFGPLRNPFLPKVTPIAKMGYPEFGALPSWYALWGPKDMPKDLVALLSRNLNSVLNDPEVASLFAKNGISVRRNSTPEQLARETESIFTSSKVILCAQNVEIYGRRCKR